jgi:hypothetical protein
VDKTCKSNGTTFVAIQMLFSGERVRNTWAICRKVGDSSPKGELIPHVVREDIFLNPKPGIAIFLALFEEPAAYQLVGEVTAHQGFDG